MRYWYEVKAKHLLRKMPFFKTGMLFTIMLILCSGSSMLHAQDHNSVSIRALHDGQAVMTGALTEKEEGVPAVQTASPGTPDDEYGDVTPEELGPASKDRKSSDEYGDIAPGDIAGAEGQEEVYDPVRPFNTAMYHFNDKLYFWAWKPVSTGYKKVVPGEVRGILLNFYENLKAPVRIINNLLQGDAAHAGTEFLSLLINSTIGFGGLRNCAQECYGIQRDYADFGQTLGKWGVGYGFYLVLPFLGPSTVRDGTGLLIDWPMRPTSYLGEQFLNDYNVGIYIHERVNFTSFHLGEYEALKDASVDPYLAMRDIYMQYRNNLIQKH